MQKCYIYVRTGGGGRVSDRTTSFKEMASVYKEWFLTIGIQNSFIYVCVFAYWQFKAEPIRKFFMGFSTYPLKKLYKKTFLIFTSFGSHPLGKPQKKKKKSFLSGRATQRGGLNRCAKEKIFF